MDQVHAFWGEKERLSDDSAVRCKGNWLSARPRYVRERFGESGIERVAARLLPEQRALFLKPPLSFAWLPIRSLYLIDEVIVDEVMGGLVSGMKEFGEAIASYDIGFLYRAFFRMGSPEFFLGKSHLIFNQYVSNGDMRTKAAKGEGETVFTQLRMPRYMCRFGIAGYLHGSIDAAGGHAIQVDHTRCIHDGDEFCVYQSRWR